MLNGHEDSTILQPMVAEDLTEDQIKNHIGVVSFALDDNTS